MKFKLKTSVTNRKRIIILLLIIFTVQLVIIGRYAWVQIMWSPQLQKWAKEQWTYDTKIDAKRGDIVDRNGEPLAVSGNVERVDAYLKDIRKAIDKNKTSKEKISSELAPILGLTQEEILKKLNKTLPNGLPMSSVTISRRIEKDQGDKIRELKLPGIVVTEDTKRYYPGGNSLSQVLGNTNIDGDGRAGIEKQYNQELKGIPGRFMGEADKFHRELPYNMSTYIKPTNGNDVVLTIDQSIQYFTEKALEEAVSKFRAKKANAVIMDPKTGEILAMASKPDYDPNKPVEGSASESMAKWKMPIVNENFEPGSIFKLFTSAAALEENLVTMNDKFVCNGSKRVGDGVRKCWKSSGHGVQTFPEILNNSCNVGYMELGEKLGKDKLYKYIDAFGLGKKTGIDFLGEEKGIIMPLSRVGVVETATIAFGQGVSITPIQFITAIGAFGNNGDVMKPHLVKKITHTDENGNTSVVKDFAPEISKKAISPETSKTIREMMEQVVIDGGSKKAGVEGYRIGGKTGTAQKVENGKYAPGKYVSSFAGIAPIDNPKFVLLLSIDEPDPAVAYYGGQTAAPTAHQLLQDILRYMGVAQDESILPENKQKVMIPDVRGIALEEAQKKLRDLKLEVEVVGTGKTVYDISPKPGMSVNQGTKVSLYLGVEENLKGKVAVPNFERMSKAEIEGVCKSLGLSVTFDGEGVAISQDVEPTTEVNKGSTIKITLQNTQDLNE
ncbi:stage V sporulation protein D [Clostridium cylindrosporum]|uniref:Stage V sporulation protein D n=1 Tax=Clostridium cylindrosporum DSM 605 TaxID=1121307 RepID=A0A0J8G0T6_CLOCY|nr:stage V sporulation protein D [Clostridium cylindrosporum]KMT21401.1 stage V sporulation protein D [Clostridium cylindrosporum DSM 605]